MASVAQAWDEVADEQVARPFPMRVEQFEALFEAGLLEDNRIELRDGVMVKMPPQYLPHVRAKMHMYDALRCALASVGSTLEVAVELSARIPPFDMPAPDLAVFDPVEKTGPLLIERAVLLVEISHTTRREDLVRKPALYARAGVPEYWVVDLKLKNTHQMFRPSTGGYGRSNSIAFGQPITMSMLPNVIVDTTGLLDV